MKSFIWRFITIILIGMTLSACSDCLTRPTDQATIATQLRRQYAYYNSSPSIEASYMSPWQKKQFMEKLRESECCAP